MDPYELIGLGLGLSIDEGTKVSLVRFHGTADMSWLMKSLEKPVKWWVHNCNRIPLILEIRELIKAHKKKGAPANRKCLVPLQIRGNTLFVLNDTQGTTLGLLRVQVGEQPGSPEKEQPGSLKNQAATLLWFCDELQKDIEHLPKKSQKPLKEDRALLEYQEAIERTLESIQAHPQCCSSHYSPSRLRFKVFRKDKTFKEIRVEGLAKKTEGRRTRPLE